MSTHLKNFTVKQFLPSRSKPMFLLAAIFSLPHVVHAQEGVSGLIESLQGIINQLIPLVASLTLLAFFWGLAKYIFNAGNEDAQEQGKRIMVGGIIALFLIASVGGIVQFMADAFGFNTGANIPPPTINLDTGDSVDTLASVYNGGDGIG